METHDWDQDCVALGRMATFDDDGNVVDIETGQIIEYYEPRVTPNTWSPDMGIGTSPSKSGLHPKRKKKHRA